VMRQFDDPDQAVSWAAILLFIDAAFDAPQLLRALFGDPGSLFTVFGLIFLALMAGKVAAGAGLLKAQRWAWPLALAVVGVSALIGLLGLQLLGLLFDALVIYLLLRPAVRERFGQR
jgi:uncharacterized membrane protein